MKSSFGISFIESIQNFATNHIESQETHFWFYLRLNLRNFEEYTDSLHEGTNRGLNYNSAVINPSMNIKKHLQICVTILKEVEKARWHPLIL